MSLPAGHRRRRSTRGASHSPARVGERYGAAVRDVVVGYALGDGLFRSAAGRIPAWLERELARSRGGAWPRRRCVRARRVDVPVCYGGEIGPDLADVARFAGCSVGRRDRPGTRRVTYRVYSGRLRARVRLPGRRSIRASPRRAARTPGPRVPAGSVAIAGGQTGIYPDATPGGWNIIGRTPRAAVRSGRAPASRRCFQPRRFGVAFRPRSHARVASSPTHADACRVRRLHRLLAAASVIIRPGMLTTVQDLGRWGQPGAAASRSPGRWTPSRIGLPTRSSGTTDDAAALEITLIGPELEADGRADVRRAGATLRGHGRRRARCRNDAPFNVPAGSRLRFGARAAGARAALAVRGGFDVAPVLRQPRDAVWSAAWARSAAARCAPATCCRSGRAAARHRRATRGRPLALPEGGARLRVIDRAARGDRSTAAAFEALCRRAVHRHAAVEPHGLSARRARASAHAGAADILSDATPIGSRAGARVGPADPADGGSADDRRISDDRDRDHGRSAARRPARSGRLDRVRAGHARATPSTALEAQRTRRWSGSA